MERLEFLVWDNGEHGHESVLTRMDFLQGLSMRSFLLSILHPCCRPGTLFENVALPLSGKRAAPHMLEAS